mmetsp:Transcript_73414/g.123688  ORF Transcript_73414/g.123688 Transcript_73414/m.123688 type:complete len:98 (+) Transcript_73414:1512-1805(+)
MCSWHPSTRYSICVPFLHIGNVHADVLHGAGSTDKDMAVFRSLQYQHRRHPHHTPPNATPHHSGYPVLPNGMAAAEHILKAEDDADNGFSLIPVLAR